MKSRNNTHSDHASDDGKEKRANSILGGDRSVLNLSSLSDDSHKAFVSISKIDTYDEERKEKIKQAQLKFEEWKVKEQFFKENNNKIPKSKNYIFFQENKMIFAERDGINRKWCYE